MRNNTLAFSYDHNQIATPTHIVDFLSDLLDVPNRKTLENCTTSLIRIAMA